MANRSDIMGLHGLKNKPSRNSFDVSARNLFTAKIGELLPCAVYEMNPGDSIRIDASYFTRTAPLQTAAFTRLRENVQFFFVPYSQLWKYFNSQVLNMTSSASGQDVSRIATSPFANEKVTTGMPYVAYSALHQYLYKMGQAARAIFPVGDFSAKFKNSVFDNNGEYRWSASSKLLQLLGYGRFDYQNMSFEDFSDKPVVGMTSLPNLSVFRLLAYQKICNDHYQFRQWQGYDASLCNVDYVTPSGSMDLSTQLEQVDFASGKNAQRLNFLDLRFSNLPLDYLNGVLPTAQFGSESVVSLSNGTSKASPSDTSGNLGWTSGADGGALSHTDSIPSDALSLSVLSLRQAYAAQKYKEIQLANDVDFASQIEAHFGVKPKHADDTSYFIGGSSSMIDINPIVNQNLSGDGLADYKASPIGNGSSKIKFTADTYGVVMGIYRCTPVLDYAHIGIDRTLCKTDASDFVLPEMDSIGMQQNYLFEVQAPSFDGVHVGFLRDQNFVKSYGYAPRYSEYKTNYDKYNGDFCFTLGSWVTGLPANMIDEICRHNLSSMQIAPELFNCRPSLCNSIFVNQNNYLVSDDKLYIGMVNMAYVTRNLSRYGLPYSN
ncbi:hypothetical protein E2488_15575 [Gramella jeungdoensis]|jgi:hypothetical protein|uniref:Major capsid protein n=1 Tax=Gramella jeungdoensis TaxID=708091 RepID=A0A4Y8AMW9_9FLAO|nr:major capsid protein [Gramella jeungdoensis]TEW71535.1 hypothetical protein E2488_15575 [Gramella jeungdoensis]